MLARDFIIILVLFGLVTGAGYFIVVDIASSESGYDIPNMTDEEYQKRYDTLNDTSTIIYKMQNATKSEKGMSVVSTFTTMFKSTFSVIGLVFGSFDMVATTMDNFGQDLGMDSSLANLVFGAILIIIITIIVFVIISSISKGRL